MWVIRRALFTTESEKCRKTILEPMESQNTFPIIPLTDLVPDLASSSQNNNKSSSSPHDAAPPPWCHEQGQSSLFSKLPAEVRKMIFELVFEQDNESDVYYGYQQNMFSCQPMMKRSIKLRTGLLGTCQRAYREAWPLVIANPQPPTHQPVNRREMSIWAKLFWFQHGGLAQNFADSNFEPRLVTLNIRHWDWYGWDTDAPLQIRQSWIASHGYRLPASCRQLNIRFQTEERKRDQLEQIIKDITLGSDTDPPWAFERTDALKMLPVHDENSPIYYLMSFSPLTVDEEHEADRLHYFAAYVTWRVSEEP